MRKTLFNARMKLADLILANPNLILMLPRLKIPFGFGNKTVAEVCSQYGIPVSFFLLICNVYSFNYYLPSREQIASADVGMIIRYLKASHQFYQEKRLPHIGGHLKRISESLSPKLAAVLKRFFEEYCDELTAHFEYEETTVFPYVETLKTNGGKPGYSIDNFTSEHSNIEDKLDDLTQIIFKYLPETAIPDEAVNVVFDILQLSEDIKKHSLIEEKILVPYAQHFEENAK